MTLGNSTWYYDSKKATSNGEFLSNTLKKKSEHLWCWFSHPPTTSSLMREINWRNAKKWNLACEMSFLPSILATIRGMTFHLSSLDVYVLFQMTLLKNALKVFSTKPFEAFCKVALCCFFYFLQLEELNKFLLTHRKGAIWPFVKRGELWGQN